MTVPLKRFGGEFRANTTIPGNQFYQKVAALASGGFAMAWIAESGDGSGYGIAAQRFTAEGIRVGGQIQVNTTVFRNQLESSVAGLPSGGFVVTWTDDSTASSSDVRGRIFDSNGTPLAPDFLVSTSTVNHQGASSVFVLANGGFVVSWVDYGQFSNHEIASNVRAQIFDSSGAKVGQEFLVHSSLVGVQTLPSGVALGTGGFVIVWNDSINGESDVRGQLFDSAGNRIGDEFQVPASAAGGQGNTDIAALPGGGFVVSWQGADPGSEFYTARAQMFDADGVRVGPEVIASNPENRASTVNVTGLASGGFLISWEDYQGATPSTRAQMFDPEGNRLGSQFQLNLADKVGGYSDLATLSSGRIVATWNYGSYDVNGQVFRAPLIGTPLADALGGGSEDDAISGLASDDILSGGGGNDTLDGGAGADRMTGGTGNDVYAVDNAGDEPIEQASEGIDEIETGLADYTLPDHFENLTGTSVAGGGQTLRGNSASNVLTGGAGAETLRFGVASNDRVQGGPGDDLLVIDWHDATTVVSMVSGPDEYFVGQHLGFRGEFQDGGVRSVVFAGIERFEVTAGSADDYLRGAGGDDRLDGGGGDDRLGGSAGADILIGGSGVDTVDYSGLVSFAKVIVNLGDGAVPNPGGDPVGAHQALDPYGDLDSLTGIENVRTGFGDDFVQGDSAGNRIETGFGTDTLIGDAGDDTLIGGAGADLMRGGIGNDLYFVDDGGDVVEENAGEGTDEVRTSLAEYSLLGTHIENLTATSPEAHFFRGNAGANAIAGNAGNDLLLLQDGGDDVAVGSAGDDVLYFGGAFTGGDRADGGEGRDVLVLQGNYALTLSATNMAGIESLSLQSGAQTRWGDTADNHYDYNITMNDANTPAGVQLIVNAQSLRGGEDFTFDGSAESDGRFLVYAGHGVDILKGGAGNDVFFFEGQRWGPDDRVDGGGGRDSVIISSGSGVNRFVFGETSFASIESISVNARFASDPTQKPSYELVLANGNVAPGATLIVNGNSIADPGQFVSFDGSAVQQGKLTLFGGAGDDILTGGAGNDLLYGGGGADSLTGGGGADIFRFDSVTDSAAAAPDTILDFVSGTDKVDLSRIDANSHASGDQAFSWIGSNAFSGAGAASAGELRVVSINGYQWVEGDTDGDGNADLVIAFQAGAAPLSAGDFLL